MQILNGGAFGQPRINWDGHENVKQNHDTQAAVMDKPVAGALIKDLKARGLFEDTLFVWSIGVRSQPGDSGNRRAGARSSSDGIHMFPRRRRSQGGDVIRLTDEIGYSIAENKVTIPDFHATILHLLGLNHEKLTFYPQRHQSTFDRCAWTCGGWSSVVAWR